MISLEMSGGLFSYFLHPPLHNLDFSLSCSTDLRFLITIIFLFQYWISGLEQESRNHYLEH